MKQAILSAIAATMYKHEADLNELGLDSSQLSAARSTFSEYYGPTYKVGFSGKSENDSGKVSKGKKPKADFLTNLAYALRKPKTSGSGTKAKLAAKAVSIKSDEDDQEKSFVSKPLSRRGTGGSIGAKKIPRKDGKKVVVAMSNGKAQGWVRPKNDDSGKGKGPKSPKRPPGETRESRKAGSSKQSQGKPRNNVKASERAERMNEPLAEDEPSVVDASGSHAAEIPVEPPEVLDTPEQNEKVAPDETLSFGDETTGQEEIEQPEAAATEPVEEPEEPVPKIVESEVIEPAGNADGATEVPTTEDVAGSAVEAEETK